jgi:hypothetical protein
MSRVRLGGAMAKKKNHDHHGNGDEPEPEPAAAPPSEPRPEGHPGEPAAGGPQAQRKTLLPALSVGDILALAILTVLSAALLLEGYYSGFKDYSKEIIALFAVVVGFLLGRKT